MTEWCVLVCTTCSIDNRVEICGTILIVLGISFTFNLNDLDPRLQHNANFGMNQQG